MDVQKILQFRKMLRRFELLVDTQNSSCCCEVTLPQCHVLLEIEDLGQATTGQLAKNLRLDKSTLSRTIDGLVNSGLVERLPNTKDRRFTPLVLTKQGKAVCAAINDSSSDYYLGVFGHIPEKKHDAVIKNFSLLVQAFQDYESRKSEETKCCDSANVNKGGNK